jgi:hypothetical protein
MRTELIEVKTRKTAIKAAPWAAKIIKVYGGYMAFESMTDAEMWKSQKRR